ncbi:hypothetical protein BaRGS_00016576, partial [Batillaria attramentaria]
MLNIAQYVSLSVRESSDDAQHCSICISVRLSVASSDDTHLGSMSASLAQYLSLTDQRAQRPAIQQKVLRISSACAD